MQLVERYQVVCFILRSFCYSLLYPRFNTSYLIHYIFTSPFSFFLQDHKEEIGMLFINDSRMIHHPRKRHEKNPLVISRFYLCVWDFKYPHPLPSYCLLSLLMCLYIWMFWFFSFYLIQYSRMDSPKLMSTLPISPVGFDSKRYPYQILPTVGVLTSWPRLCPFMCTLSF